MDELVSGFHDCLLFQGEDLHVSCYYIDYELNAYAISPAQVRVLDYDSVIEFLEQLYMLCSCGVTRECLI